MPTAHDQETLDQWDWTSGILWPLMLGEGKRWFLWKLSLSAVFQLGYGEKHLFLFPASKRFLTLATQNGLPGHFQTTQCSINCFPSCRTPFEAYTNNPSICYPYISMTCFSSKHLSVIIC